ncbi:MAG TPA: glycosyltransferase family 2 protein [Thermoanaerobaculia bacterium]|nr:glycosyltransferase family 2 protein [Thermoanaerobaculia bacterium]
MASVEVVIVSWNGREDTLRAVESVLGQSEPPSVSRLGITVVDNGSTDGTADAVAAAFPRTRILRNAVNRGFTGGVRLGVELADADLVVLLNNDAVAEPRWLHSLVGAILAAPPDVVAVAGKIVDPTGALADFVGGAMTFDGHGFQIGFRLPLESTGALPAGAEMLFACGGNMIVRRRDFLDLGGFDDDYFAYLEDVDFGWRAWAAGRRIVWEPAAVVRHRSAATSERLGSFERGVLFERNALQTAVKNFDDALFPGAAGAVFLTALHRLHRYVIDRNVGTSRLRRPPLDEAPIESPPSHGRLARLVRRLGLRIAKRTPSLDDELTAMQFRALEWFFANSQRVMQKRAAVQAMRTRPDREIFERFPLLVVPTYHGDESLMASELFRAMIRDLPHRDAALEDIMRR